MDTRIRIGLLIAATALAAPLAQARAQARDSLPPGVTAALIERGRAVFTGPGACFACHGMEARGALAPSLADTLWLHSDGSFDAIVAQVRKGVPASESKSGVVMPPLGGTQISEQDVRAVAAYVWSLSRKG